MQKQYGKTTGQLETVVKGFAWLLDGYDYKLVVNGLKQYLRRHNDIPSPSDIINIIDPPKPVWQPDKSYYIKLQEIVKKSNYSPYALNDDEKEYIEKYEKHMQIARKNGDE